MTTIGLIGAGKIGSQVARLAVARGYDVVLSNSRGPESLADFVAPLGDRARAATPAEAEQFGEVVVVSIPFGRYRDVPTEGVAGKVVIDTNNYYPQRDGNYEELDTDRTTSSELLQEHLPDARVVKAFNAIVWTRLRDEGRPAGDPDRIGIPMSGDDPDAKRVVAQLMDEIGFDAVDAGTLAEGSRKHQVDAPGYTQGLPTAELRERLSG